MAIQTETTIPPVVQPEQAVLGSLLVNSYAIAQVSTILEPSDFWLPQHQVIYAAMLRLTARKQPTDIVLLADELNGDIEAAGGIGYLASLGTFDGTPVNVLNVLHYAGLVLDQSRRRRLMEAGERLARGTGDVDEAVEAASSMLADVRQRRAAVEWENKTAWLTRLEERILGEPREEDQGIPTGLRKLDALMRGMHKGDLVTVAASTSVGKTSMATTIAHHLAARLKRRVLFFSLEMLRDPIGEKLLCLESGLTWRRLTGYGLAQDERERVTAAAAILSAAPIDVVPARGWTIEQICKAASDAHRNDPLSMIVVDYLQRVHVARPRDNREQTVSSIVDRLKDTALEMECVVLALAQLNRESQHRPGLPMLSDLRESGSIEMDSDTVLLLSRESPDVEDDQRPPLENIVTQVAKNRMGDTGKVMLGFRTRHMEFVDLADESRQTPPALTSSQPRTTRYDEEAAF